MHREAQSSQKWSFFLAMSIDKSLIRKQQNTLEYVDRVRKFLDFAFEHGPIDRRVIRRP